MLNMKDANSKQRNAFVSLGDSRFIAGQFARFESLYAVNSVLTLKTPAAILSTAFGLRQAPTFGVGVARGSIPRMR